MRIAAVAVVVAADVAIVGSICRLVEYTEEARGYLMATGLFIDSSHHDSLCPKKFGQSAIRSLRHKNRRNLVFQDQLIEFRQILFDESLKDI